MRTLEQVKSLIVQGLSNKEIADICCITTGGVKYHVTNLIKEYGVNNRSKLINEIRKSQILTEGIGKDQSECPVVKSFLGDRNGV